MAKKRIKHFQNRWYHNDPVQVIQISLKASFGYWCNVYFLKCGDKYQAILLAAIAVFRLRAYIVHWHWVYFFSCSKCTLKEGNKCNTIENTLESSLTVNIESLDSTTCLIKRTQVATDNASIDKDLSFLQNVDEMEQIQMSTIIFSSKHHVTNHVLLILYIHFALSLVSNPTSTFSFSGHYYKRSRSKFFPGTF